MPRRRRLSLLTLGVALVLLLSACAQDAPQDSLEPEGPISRQIDNLLNPVFWVAVAVFIFVQVGVLVMALRFRRRRRGDHGDEGDDDSELPRQTHGNTKLEIGWTLLPAGLLTVVAIGTLVTLFDIQARADDAEVSIQVVGNQWYWDYNYDLDDDGAFDDVETANDLVIPAGQDVNLEITSNDVVHSYWIPKLAGKQDAVPGRSTTLTINADEPGVFLGQCVEFCGLGHGTMRQRAVALTSDQFDEWLQNQAQPAEMPPEGTAARRGAELFATQCSICHLAEGINDAEFEEQGSGDDLVAGPAPNLTHFASRGAFAGALFDLWQDTDGNGFVDFDEIGGELNRRDLADWLRDPPSRKPMAPDQGRGMPNLGLQDAQIDDLIAFLETLE